MKMIVIDFKFDGEAFSDALKTVKQGDLSDFADIIGVDTTTLANWRGNRWNDEAPYPRMTNFLNACNWMDLDPRQFFVLDVRKDPDGTGIKKQSSPFPTAPRTEFPLSSGLYCDYCAEEISDMFAPCPGCGAKGLG